MSIARGKYVAGRHVGAGNKMFRSTAESKWNAQYRSMLPLKAHSNFSPNISRNTGMPHEHKREIARRLRQKGGAA